MSHRIPFNESTAVAVGPFNKQNWTGEEATIRVDREAMSFELWGSDLFQLVPVASWDDPDYGFERYAIHGENWLPDHVLGYVTRDTGAKCHSKQIHASQNPDSELAPVRDDPDDLFKAAAKLLFNIV